MPGTKSAWLSWKYPLAALVVVILLVGGVWYLIRRPPSAVEQLTHPPKAAEDRVLALGRALFTQHCAACHGDRGNGEGPAARFLYPRPRNFHEGKFRIVTSSNARPSDEDLLRVITRGMPGSAMFPFGHLPENEQLALVRYVRYLMVTGFAERLQAADPDADPQEVHAEAERLLQPADKVTLPGPLPPATKEVLARGEALYQKTCATCHGKTGKGDGTEVMKDDHGMLIRPRDFTRGIFKGSREPEQLYARIMVGMPGAPMPSQFPAVTPETVGDVIQFILSLSDPSSQDKVEHRRRQIVARQIQGTLGSLDSDAWQSLTPVPIVLTPLWWREYSEPDLQVRAAHDGKTLYLSLTWNDASRNDALSHLDDFEDMAAVQIYDGEHEPFLGMGAETARVDIWHWCAARPRSLMAGKDRLDLYPLDEPLFQRLVADAKLHLPDMNTARAVGNPIADVSSASLVAKGFGSTTFLPRSSQLVASSGKWRQGRWHILLQRPLVLEQDRGLALQRKHRYSIAFAIWDGAAKDRNGQKLVSIWHDLVLE